MGGAQEVLSNDVEELRRTVVSLQKNVTILEEEIRFLKDRLFGRKTDRIEDEHQERLFNEAEAGAEQSEESEQQAPAIVVAAHTRRPRGRRPLPENLPREEVVHDIPEEQKICACGAPLSRIGEETSEKLKIIPPKLIVVRHIRPKYACRACQGVETKGGAVKIAPTSRGADSQEHRHP